MVVAEDVPHRPAAPTKGWFGHPAGLSTLFFTEMWERFSFYGMRAILTLFLAAELTDGGFGMDDAAAASIFATYNSMVYLMSLPGGWIADRVLGTRKSVLLGGIIIALGHYVLAITVQWTFYLGLCLIVLGTGLLKPNISAMVGELYDKHTELPEARRDAGFTLFYMAINIGALLAPLITGLFAERKQFHIGFGIAAVGMTFAVIQYVIGGRRLEGVGLTPHRPLLSGERRKFLTIAAIVAGVVAVLVAIDVAAGTFNANHVKYSLGLLALGVPIAYFVMMFRDRELAPQEHSRIQAFVWIFIGATLFWMIYDQAGSVLTLFTEKKVDRDLGFLTIPTAWFQSINSAFILLLAPLFAWMWIRMGSRQPGTPQKFSWAIIGVGLSFIIMAVAGSLAAKGLISAWWIILVYLVQTIAELLLSPVGLSATTKLAPLRYASQVMGLWFLATAAGNALNIWIAPLSKQFSDVVYYGTIGGIAVVMGFAFWMGAKAIQRLMAGVH